MYICISILFCMEQILVTIGANQSLQNICKAINMLRGVVSTTILKEPIQTKTQMQQEYVRDSLTKAFREVKLAKQEGRELQSVDDFLKELDGTL